MQQIVVRGRTAGERTALGARIDAAVSVSDSAVMLLAQGGACAALAWWARLSPKSYIANVSGALLVAPEAAGFDRRDYASPKTVLPFPSIVVGANDEAQRLGVEWGSRLIDGPLLNATSAPTGRLRAVIERFTAAVVERDVIAAYRIIQAIGDG
ncbi:MAG TPA: alpha/beta hydrolase [Sphingomonas sp.]|nr:alpha/beta hydrolase [Sphingomonas sp.]